MSHSLNFRVPAGLAALALFAAAPAVSTVGLYAPNPNAIAIADAASNTAANGLTLASFQALVAVAHTANLGGVIDFEVATGWPAVSTNVTSVAATYGLSGADSLTISRTDSANGFNSNTNNGTNVVSGTGYLGFQLQNATFTFGTGLSAFGITMLPRGVVRRSTLTFTLDDASTLVTSQETTNATNALFFGVRAPVGRTITSVAFAEPDGFTRYDDLGFAVNPVPEPASLTALAFGGLALLRRRSK